MPTETLPNQTWFRPKEAGEYLRVSPALVYKLTQHGLLRAYRVGRRCRRYKRQDLDALPQVMQQSPALN